MFKKNENHSKSYLDSIFLMFLILKPWFTAIWLNQPFDLDC